MLRCILPQVRCVSQRIPSFTCVLRHIPLQVRPLEQYPNEIDDMARYMRDSGVLSRLGVPDCPPEHPNRVHRSLKQHNLGHGKVENRWDDGLAASCADPC